MEVLKSITSYVEHMKGNDHIYEGQRRGLEMLYKYCDHTEPEMALSEIDWYFFDEFLMYWLPKNQSRLNEKEVYQILSGIGGYCSYIQETYNIHTLYKSEVEKEYQKEYLRIYKLKRLFLEYLGDPILSLEPFVIDFKIYGKRAGARKAINLFGIRL